MTLNKWVVVLVAGWAHIVAATAQDTGGFLTPQTAPDSLAILPPPPAENSVTFQADKARYESGRVLPDPARVAQARQDADYKNFAQVFTPAFGMEISAARTPALHRLLTAVLQDSHDYAMRTAKEHYNRVRPFVLYKNPTCTPEQDQKLAASGSYPSGHASFGWAAALVLTEINPARQTELLRRGYDFGISRVVCGAHWQSDVDKGQLMGAAVVAALQAEPAFRAALAAAKAEFVAVSAQQP
jgi:acid phosphatase (class A)